MPSLHDKPTECVCKPGNPCMWHYSQVVDGYRRPSEVPFPENYRLVRRRFLHTREWLARKLAPWLEQGPTYERNASATPKPEERL